MQFKKITSNLYKYNDNNTYLISINKKNNNGEQIKINQYIKANNDEDAINYLQKIYKDYNLISKKRPEPTSQLVDKYIYKYGKDHYRLIIKKSKLFPNRIDEYHNLPLKEVKEIRDNYIAKARLNKLEKNGLNEKYKNWTLNDFKSEYIEKYCLNKLSKVTVSWYEHMLDYYILPKFGDYKLTSLQNMVSELQEFTNNLKNIKKKVWKKGKLIEGKETISTKTQNSIYGIFKGVLTRAVNFKAMETNPLTLIEAPKIQNKPTEFFALDELYEILDILKKEEIKIRFMFTLIICTGIRKGELVGLHLEDLNFEKNEIDIKREVVVVKGQGIVEKEPKTKNGIRTIPVPPFCMEMAKKYLEEREKNIIKLKKKYGLDYKEPKNIFLGRFGNIMYPDTPYGMWIKFRDKNGLKSVTVHGLRHSWCTAELHDNDFLTDVEVAKLMGHGKNINMTQHYNQVIDKRISKSTAIFNQYEENLKTDKGKVINFSYEEIITILSGKPYTNIQNIKTMIERYYELIDKEILISELSTYLFGIKQDLLSYDGDYKIIENYLLNNKNDDWKILTEGKENFGSNFNISKKNFVSLDKEKNLDFNKIITI